MKTRISVILMSAAIVLSSCGLNKTIVGAGAGTVAGGALGYMIGNWTGNKALGAGIGAVAGGAAGAIIGNKMQKAKEEAEKIANAKVEATTDENGNTIAVKVTLNGDITFDTSKATLKAAPKEALSAFAKGLPADVDLAIVGYTDSTGSDAINNPLSENRAKAVEQYLMSQGISAARFKSVIGKGSQEPVADNSTVAGRAQNRRAELYLFPSQAMINSANSAQ